MRWGGLPRIAASCPGEFGNLRSIARMRGDTIVAWDPPRRRVSYFADDGTFIEGVTLTGWSAVHEALLQAGEPGLAVSAYALHVLEDGDVVLEPYFYRAPDAMEETRVLQDSLPLVAFDRTGERGVTIGTFPGPESFVRNRTGSLLRFGERLVRTSCTWGRRASPCSGACRWRERRCGRFAFPSNGAR